MVMKAQVEAAARAIAIARFHNPTSFYMLDTEAQNQRVQREMDLARAALDAADSVGGEGG